MEAGNPSLGVSSSTARFPGLAGKFALVEQLSQPITDIESDGKGLPILLRQYARIGGKVLGFNVDKKFSRVVDGLVLVDLRQTETAVLERYMGREEAKAFRQVHLAAK